jgi:hypothetical protein
MLVKSSLLTIKEFFIFNELFPCGMLLDLTQQQRKEEKYVGKSNIN